MVQRLKKQRFEEALIDLPEVQAFDCGQEPWEKEVADWIKSRSGDHSVLVDLKTWPSKVWLYWTDTNQLVGYASHGENTWSMPPPKGPKHRISYIPFIG